MAGKGSRTRFLDREIRMVLVGKTGVGKSETGNTICGNGEEASVFESDATAQSVTTKSKQHSFKRFGYDLQLVDVPGFCDTSRSHEDIKEEIMKCVGMSAPGIHAILFTVRIGRFTDEDKNTLETFLQCFGKEAKRFVIVVFTGKDDLEAKRKTLDNYINSCPVKLKTFLYDTSHRFISVNNRGTNEDKEKFTKDLIDMVKHMVDENGGHCYTNEMYEQCEADLREAAKTEKLDVKRQKQLEEKLQQETAAFEKQLQSQRLKMQEMEEQIEKERKERKKDREDQLKEQEKKHLEEEKKHLEEEKKRQAVQKEAAENMQRELERMKEFQKMQMEEFERKKEELKEEETRKQIREKIEEGKVGIIRTAARTVTGFLSSLW